MLIECVDPCSIDIPRNCPHHLPKSHKIPLVPRTNLSEIPSNPTEILFLTAKSPTWNPSNLLRPTPWPHSAPRLPVRCVSGPAKHCQGSRKKSGFCHQKWGFWVLPTMVFTSLWWFSMVFWVLKKTPFGIFMDFWSSKMNYYHFFPVKFAVCQLE